MAVVGVMLLLVAILPVVGHAAAQQQLQQPHHQKVMMVCDERIPYVLAVGHRVQTRQSSRAREKKAQTNLPRLMDWRLDVWAKDDFKLVRENPPLCISVNENEAAAAANKGMSACIRLHVEDTIFGNGTTRRWYRCRKDAEDIYSLVHFRRRAVPRLHCNDEDVDMPCTMHFQQDSPLWLAPENDDALSVAEELITPRDWWMYRLGDAVKSAKYGNFENNRQRAQQLIMRNAILRENSIGASYIKANGAAGDYGVLNDVVSHHLRRRRSTTSTSPSPRDTLVLHIRVGDVLCYAGNYMFDDEFTLRGTSELFVPRTIASTHFGDLAWWEAAIDVLLKNQREEARGRSKVVIIAGIHVPLHNLTSCVMHSARYILSRVALLRARGFAEVEMRLGRTPDDDVMFVSENARSFLSTGGGFGEVITNLLRYRHVHVHGGTDAEAMRLYPSNWALPSDYFYYPDEKHPGRKHRRVVRDAYSIDEVNNNNAINFEEPRSLLEQALYEKLLLRQE